MFEEVPRERRGMARLVPVRRVVLGPFVLGGGMLLAALGGSVAVAAAAATMITASAITSKDVPARPGHAVAPASSTHQPSVGRSPAPHRTATPSVTDRSSAARRSGVTVAPRVPHLATVPGSTAVAVPAPARTVTVAPPPRPTATAAPSRPAVPPSSGPLGNAVIHVSGYDPATARLSYQFASVRAGAGTGGGDLYQVLDSATFTAALAPSTIVTSGGSICAPAGSACTRDQLIRAAGSGFFAVAAIDAGGSLRSVVEVGGVGGVGAQPPTPKLTPVPGTASSGARSRWTHPDRTSPAPSASPTATS
jgi:hypothetical protein